MTVRQALVQVNGIEIVYREVGSGPPVILLHGGWLDGRHFEKNWPALADRFRVISYDRRGCGGSSSEVPHSAEHWAEDLRQLIWALAGGRAILVGSSYGGLTVMEAFARFPSLVRAAVISAARGSGFTGPEEPHVTFHDRIDDLRRVTVPVRVIHGADDTGCPPALGQAVAEAIPGADFVLVPGAGHSVHRHQPEAFNAALREFLLKAEGEG